MMKLYDYIIIGCGAAGRSLAYHLVHSPLRHSKLLLIDQDTLDRHDHAWGFWADQPTLFDEIVYRSWDQLEVRNENAVRLLPLSTYRYKMIRGSDFYQFTQNELAHAPHVEIVQGNVDGIDDDGLGASLLVGGECYRGRFVFDSRFHWSSFHYDPARYHCLKQQFLGWEIETADNVFDPRTALLFDTHTTQKRCINFFYLLPFSEHHALVEYVLCSETIADWQNCKQALSTYIETALGSKIFSLLREERGITPLTDWPFSRQIGKHIMTIGIAGGKIKPSTGYAFTRIQQDAAAIVASLVSRNHPFHVPPTPLRYRFFDSVMLDIVEHHKEWVRPIFVSLFEHQPIERILRFLDERGSLWENLLMLPSLPPKLLAQTALHIDMLTRV